MKKTRKTNPVLLSLIHDLKKASWDNHAPIWRDIAKRLEKASSKWSKVNVSKINKYAKEKETIIVPGKVMGAGEINKPVTVAAYSFSEGAVRKIEVAKGAVLTIRELLNKKPKGKGVRIIG